MPPAPARWAPRLYGGEGGFETVEGVGHEGRPGSAPCEDVSLKDKRFPIADWAGLRAEFRAVISATMRYEALV